MAYLALRWSGRPAAETLGLLGRARRTLAEIDTAPGWALFTDPGEPALVLSRGEGAAVGELYDRSKPARRLTGATLDQEARAGNLPAALGRDYWGRYVAMLRDPKTHAVQVRRDPSGALGCFHTRRGQADLIFSDPAIVMRLGLLAPDIDWSYLAHHIAFGGVRVARTGLVGVSEVLPGQVLVLEGGEARTATFWRPADHIAATTQINDPYEAAHVLRGEIEMSTAALATSHPRLVVELSGGLDSSLIALALADVTDAIAVNCSTSGAEGDERAYAREVAKAAGLPLVEKVLDPADIDFRQRPRPWMARPGRTTVLQPVDKAFAIEATIRGATAFFNGTGGDSIFGYSMSAAPLADRLLSEGLGAGVMETAMDIAELTGATVWTVAKRALQLARRRAPAPVLPETLHLAPCWRPAALEPQPWLQGLDGALPGRRRHIAAISGLHGHVDGHDRGFLAPVIAPHASLPVLETVLRIPTWLTVAGGRDRAVARQAFADVLPRSVLERGSKGRINRFIAQSYLANRAIIIEVLKNGVLAEQGLLDVEAVLRTAAAPLSLDEPAFMALIRLIDVELWAQGWLDPGES